MNDILNTKDGLAFLRKLTEPEGEMFKPPFLDWLREQNREDLATHYAGACWTCLLDALRRREEWPQGPWDDEPDAFSWEEDVYGLRMACHAHRNTRGAWCGYVCVPDYFASEDMKDAIDDLRVHGGVTWTPEAFPQECQGIGGPGDQRLWLGFDCDHAWDLSPRHGQAYLAEATYKTLAYVRQETRSLAEQVHALIVAHKAAV